MLPLLAPVSSHVGRGSMEGACGRVLKKEGRKTLSLRVSKKLNSAATILEADFLKVDLQIR